MQQRSKQEIEKIKSEANRLIAEGKVISKADSDRILNMIAEMREDFKTDISSQKDIREKMYNSAMEKKNSYYHFGESIKYNLLFSESLYLFLKDFILNKLEYNREMNIYGTDVYSEFFDKFDNTLIPTKAEIKSDLATVEEINGKMFYTFSLPSSTVFKISFLTSMFENKGINERSFKMRQLYQLITDVSNIIEYFNILGSDVEKEFEKWRYGFNKYDTEELNNVLTE